MLFVNLDFVKRVLRVFWWDGDVQMWGTVKGSNPSMGVCEISATIGRLWRELAPEDKQRHNDEYTVDKVSSCLLSRCRTKRIYLLPCFMSASGGT